MYWLARELAPEKNTNEGITTSNWADVKERHHRSHFHTNTHVGKRKGRKQNHHSQAAILLVPYKKGEFPIIHSL